MKIAFITPSLHTLGPRWRRDPQIVKLAAPVLSGALHAQGRHEIRQHDFEVEIFALEEREPGRLNLRAFFDDAAVDAFLADGGGPVGEQVDLILDTLQVEQADLFALSIASVLEVYADMHGTGNICLCLARALKQRFPGCRTVVGGLRLSPDEKQRTEYALMLERCRDLDFAVFASRGEGPLLSLVDHLEKGLSFEEMGQGYERAGGGILLKSHTKQMRLPPGFARPDGAAPRLLPTVVTPEEAPQGDHARAPLYNPSIYVTPWFDPRNVQRRTRTGREVLRRYHLEQEWAPLLESHLDKGVVVLPMIFMEGCNARCAFCSYSMTKMVRREIDEVIRAIAWVVDTYGVRYFHFLNTNLNAYLPYAETFCDALIEARLDIRWSDCANLWALNERLLEKMRRSGCIRLTFGLECPSDRMLEYIGKGINVKQAHARLKAAHDLGIWNQLLLITGLPTETEEDTKAFIDFLEKSRDYSNAYSVSSFYLITSSLMGAFPDRYGLEMLPNPSGLLEDAAFDEKNGLPWARKKQQIIDSTRIVTETIQRLKVDPKYFSGSIDLELLFLLYDALGHDRKADIVRAYEQAYLGAPDHAKYYRPHVERALAEAPLAAAARKAGIELQRERIELRRESLVVPARAGSVELDLHMRALDAGKPPTLSGGRALGVSAAAHLPIEAALEELTAPGGEFQAALTRAGWRLTQRGLRKGVADAGFRIEWGKAALDLLFAPVMPGERSFLEKGRIALGYSVPPGFADPTNDPRVLPFLRQIGRWLLDRLAAAPGAEAMSAIDPAALRAFAADLVAAAEAPFQAELDAQHGHDGGFAGKRYGDKFSRVA